MTAVLRQTKILGLIFLALVVAAVYLTYGIFSHTFSTYDEVTLKTSTIGLQLPERADVKIRGVIVGQVIDMSADTGGAKLTLGIFPSQAHIIPANVTGSIVPKTLFGEKYVSLIVPDQPAGQSIEAGDVIERTAVSTEVEEVLDDLYPLLTTVQPGKLNMTLNALATALEGRGEQLGQNIETVNSYLTRINPQIPLLVDDLRKAITVSDTYADALPQIGTILHDTVTTTTTLESREQRVHALLTDVTAFSGTAQTFLEDNGDNLITLGQVTQAQLSVLARYSTEFPCLLQGVVNAGTRQAEAFRGFTLHIVLETLPNQPRGYTPADAPSFGDDRGPNCLHLPNPPWSQANPITRLPDFTDGVNSPTGKGTDRAPADYGTSSDAGSSGATSGAGTNAGAGTPQLGGFGSYAGSPQEADVLKTLLAPGLGVAAADVPDLGPLLLAPMTEGATVSMGDPAPSADDGGGAR